MSLISEKINFSKNILLVDVSYMTYARFFATRIWYNSRYGKEEEIDNNQDWTKNSKFMESFERLFFNKLEDFRKRLEIDLKINKLRRRDLDSRIKVSEADIDIFLQKQSDTPTRNQYLAAHILIKRKTNNDVDQTNEAKGRASEALKRIDQGVDFRTVAAELSDASDALEGGCSDGDMKSNYHRFF